MQKYVIGSLALTHIEIGENEDFFIRHPTDGQFIKVIYFIARLQCPINKQWL